MLTVALFILFALIEVSGREHATSDGLTAGRMITNFGLTAMTGGLSLLVPLSSVGSAMIAEEQGIGLFNVVTLPWWLILPAALLSRTFFNYWLHRAFHAVPLLWRLHRIHHSDTHVDLTLSLRQHPFDLFPRLLVFIGGTFLLGLPVWAVAIVDLSLTAANYWEHIDRRMSPQTARVLGAFLVTPEIHRIHHSASQPQTDSNFGGGLIIWDRLFGTYLDPETCSVHRIGLGETDDMMAKSLWQQLLLPFKSLKP